MVQHSFAQYIRETIKEPIEAIVIGAYGWGKPSIPQEKRGVLLKPDEALALLDYPYKGGYGEPDCHAVYIWATTEVWWITQYDGSTQLSSAPRNPTIGYPQMPGGG